MTKRKNPDTSIAAYKSLRIKDLTKIYRDIISALAVIGMGTSEDIAAHMKIEKSRVWKRLSELEGKEKIYRPGIKKAMKSGREGYIWMLTSETQPKTTVTEKALKGKSISDYSKDILKTTKNNQQNLFS